MRSVSETASPPVRTAKRLSLLAVGLAFVSVVGCDQTPTTPEISPFVGKAVPKSAVVEVTALHQGGQHLFELSVDEVPAGWTTFRFDNRAHVHHFGLVSKVPDPPPREADGPRAKDADGAGAIAIDTELSPY